MKEYQHPSTFQPFGNLGQDYGYAFANYEADLAGHLPADREAKNLYAVAQRNSVEKQE